ncbi:MAG: fumarate hydratase [Enterocloster bolteae]
MTHEDAKQRFPDIMEKFIGMSGKQLPDMMMCTQKLKECGEKEDSDIQKVIYNAYFENLDMAGKLSRPCCQDTGLLRFYIKMGDGIRLSGHGSGLSERGHPQCYLQRTLRHEHSEWCFEEECHNDNTGERMPWINWDIVPDNDDLEIYNSVFRKAAAACRDVRGCLSLLTDMRQSSGMYLTRCLI